MKYILIYILSICCYCANAQSIVNRSSSALTVQDARFSAQYNLLIPRYLDTASANSFIGIDSCSALIFTYSDNSYWLRACSPKRWIKILKTGDVASSLANNGLSKSGDTVQLGSVNTTNNPLNHNTWINGGGFKLTVQGSTTSGNLFESINLGSGTGVFGQSVSEYGVLGSSGSLYGVYGTSTTSNAIRGWTTNGNTAAYFEGTASSTNTVIPTVQIKRTTDGTAAAGIGSSIEYYVEKDNGANNTVSNSLRSLLTTATSGAEVSQFEIYGVNSAALARKAALAGTGQWTWDGYPALTEETDTTANQPLGINRTTGAVVPMANWVGGGGSSGVTTMQPIGASPNVGGATISGVNLTLQPATTNLGGVITKDTQSLSGDKYFLSKRTTFYGPNGKSPIVNALYAPSSIASDSFYIAGKYIGFGFIDRFTSGTVVQVVFQADDHVGTNAHIRMRRSYDQGRSWTTKTIDTGSTGYYVTGIGGGITHSNRLVVFLERINTVGDFLDQRIMYSDDEGETFSAQQIINDDGQTIFQPYGPLCKIGGDSVLLSWYGSTGSTYATYVIKSGDDGVTWSSPITIASGTATQNTETSVMYLGGNILIALARREQADSAYGQYISRDNGTTWAYQGKTSFGQSGTPPWTKVFKGKNGKLICVTYYKTGSYTGQINAIYGYADSITLGPQYWNASSAKIIVPTVHGNGYIQVAHPNYDPYSIGTYYDETIIIDDATTKYLNVPLNGDMPLDYWETVSAGINYNQGGFVGINKPDPEAKLDIRGNELKASGVDESPLILGSRDDANRLALSFYMLNSATSSERGVGIDSRQFGVGFTNISIQPFTTSGNVGIHVKVPLSPFHVVSASSGASGYSTRLTDNNATNGFTLLMGNTALSTDQKYKGINITSAGMIFGKVLDALTATTEPAIVIDNSTAQRVGFGGITAPSARIHIEGGSSFGGTAPLKINSGTLMSTPENGAFENDGTTIYATVGGVRYPITGGAWTNVTGGINYSGGFVGIKNATPTVSLDVKGGNAKAGSAETVAVFGSSDAAQALNLFIDVGNNATAGSRYLSLQGVESGVAFRPLVFQPSGSNVLIGTVTDNGSGAKLQVSGNATFGTTNSIVGTATNNDAIAGNIGEEINSTVSTYTNYTTTATYQNIASITLTAGDWDLSAFFTYSSNSATITAAANAIFVVSTTTASAAGATEGVNIAYVPQAALLGTSLFSEAISPYRVSIASTTTYYLNTQATFTLGNPQYVGGLRARRVR